MSIQSFRQILLAIELTRYATIIFNLRTRHSRLLHYAQGNAVDPVSAQEACLLQEHIQEYEEVSRAVDELGDGYVSFAFLVWVGTALKRAEDLRGEAGMCNGVK